MNEPAARTKAENTITTVQVDEGAFMNLTSAVQSIHLHIWVTVQSTGTLRMESLSLNDERALVHGAGRLFFRGDAEEATKQIRQAQAGFNRKKSEWERRVRQSEDDSANRRAMRELQQKKGKHNPISTRIAPAENQFRRLVEALDIHVTLERKREIELREAANQSASNTSEHADLCTLPVDFLDAFRDATDDQRQAVVKQFFDLEAEVTVDLTTTEQQQVSVKFDPPLPKHRLYYLVDEARLFRLRRVKITNNVFYNDCLTGQNDTLPLQTMIESVQAGGVWLLRPKSDAE